MSREDALLFALCRQRMTDERLERVRALCSGPIDWESLAQTAESHGVAPMIAFNLLAAAPSDAGPPEAVRQRLSGLLIRNMALEQAIAGRMADILGFFNAHGLEVMPIKGAALKLCVYDRPWFTTAWDVDLIVGAREQDLAPELRAEIGGLLSASAGGPCYVEYNYRTHHDLVTPGGLRLDFDAIWARSRELRVGERRARIMAPEDLLIAACINSCRKRYFRLKAMFDVAEIVDVHPGLDWGAVAGRSRDAGCGAIVYAALEATTAGLANAVPPAALAALPVHPARRALIRALAERMSFASLATLDDGRALFGRRLGTALLLPYATYGAGHALRGLRQVFRESRAAGVA